MDYQVFDRRDKDPAQRLRRSVGPYSLVDAIRSARQLNDFVYRNDAGGRVQRVMDQLGGVDSDEPGISGPDDGCGKWVHRYPFDAREHIEQRPSRPSVLSLAVNERGKLVRAR